MVILWSTVIVLVFFFGVFIIGQILNNNSIVDIAWGLGFVVLYGLMLLVIGEYDLRRWLLMVMIGGWGLRLSYHIWLRNHGKPEDFRYQAMRQQWGTHWVRLKALVYVFLLQGLLLWVISFGLLNLLSQPTSGWTMLDSLGLLIWVVGIGFEVIGDWQLAKFKKDPTNKGKLMTTGLWAYTRHPNYFGEAVLWWGIWLIVLGGNGAWYTIISPLTITYLLMFVSGVPLLEKKMSQHPQFKEYAQHAGKFFPRIGKR